MKLSLPSMTIGALALTMSPHYVHGIMYKGTITVENLAPLNGTCQTPVWVGIHDGTFDTYDRDMPSSEALEPLAEDGINDPIIADFAATSGTVWDDNVGTGPICYNQTETLEFEIDVTPGAIHYFSYASMVLPSNDAFVSNGNPEANIIFDAEGNFVPVTLEITGEMVLDAGTEVNDEIPENTAFFGQTDPDTGVDEDGVVVTHPGFNAVGSGGILDDTRFVNADFKAADYKMMKITVEAAKVQMMVSGTVTVTNKAPMNGTCQTPVWVGVHAGTFDTYDRDEPASEALEPLAEDGDNDPIIADFNATNGTVWDGNVGMGPICYADTVTLPFSFALVPGVVHYFSYASMVLPSNDAFISNGNPEAHPIFDAEGNFMPLTLDIMGDMVLDAGTEVNDEIPENTAFFGQTTPNTGVDENGVVIVHPGFNPAGSGGILDDPRFVNGDFKAADYQMVQIVVALDGDMGPTQPPTGPTEPPTGPTPPPAGTPMPTDASSAGTQVFFSGKIIGALCFVALGMFV